MTRKIVPVTPERHAGKCWQRFKSYGFAASASFAPLTMAEIAKAIHSLPLCFIRANDRFQLAALLSPVAGDNYYVAPDGTWLGSYVPACFRGHPFLLAPHKDRSKLILCVDESCELISDEAGEPFVGPDRQPSPAVVRVMEFLQKVEQNRVLTQQVVDALAEAGLIVQWPLKVKIGGQEVEVPGVHRIDEALLNSLDDATFLRIRKVGGLPIVYGQLFSMGNVGMFERLAQIRSQRKPVAPGEADIEKLFDENGMLRLDNC
jgi:hypothetical protein